MFLNFDVISIELKFICLTTVSKQTHCTFAKIKIKNILLLFRLCSFKIF